MLRPPLGLGTVSGSVKPIAAATRQNPAARSQTAIEAIGAEHELAEERAEREPAPQAEAVQAQRLATALLRGEVRDHRGGADEEHRLAEPREEIGTR